MASYTSRHHCHLNPSTEYHAKEARIKEMVQETFGEAERVEVLWAAEPVAELTIWGPGLDVLSPENERRWAKVVRALAGITVFVVQSRKLFTSDERDALENGTGEAA